MPPGTVTFTPTSRTAANTLGSQPLVANGLAFDEDGDLFVADTARGAIWKVEFDRQGALRSDGPLEFPTSPFLVARRLCLTHSDGNRRDNVPNTGGEVGPGIPERAKISCLDQLLDVRGLPLPVRQEPTR